MHVDLENTTTSNKNSKHFGISSCQYFFHYQNKDILENVTKVESSFSTDLD